MGFREFNQTCVTATGEQLCSTAAGTEESCSILGRTGQAGWLVAPSGGNAWRRRGRCATLRWRRHPRAKGLPSLCGSYLAISRWAVAWLWLFIPHILPCRMPEPREGKLLCKEMSYTESMCRDPMSLQDVPALRARLSARIHSLPFRYPFLPYFAICVLPLFQYALCCNSSFHLELPCVFSRNLYVSFRLKPRLSMHFMGMRLHSHLWFSEA